MTGNNQIEIIKANGEREPFMAVKLENSLLRTGADIELIEEIMEEVIAELKDGMTTKYIYDKAFSLLDNKKRTAAKRYSLRQAVMDLGPTGFPFEDFIAHIFETRGFETETGVMLGGECAEHEIDVVARKDSELNLIEAKFHNERGIKSDIRTALYVKARYDDLSKKSFAKLGDRKFDHGWLITNTKFTSSAISYGTCAGIKMVGWNYPASGNLQEFIEESKLQPLTVLTSISENAKKQLTETGTVLCRSLLDNREALRTAGLSDDEASIVFDEVNEVCKTR